LFYCLPKREFIYVLVSSYDCISRLFNQCFDIFCKFYRCFNFFFSDCHAFNIKSNRNIFIYVVFEQFCSNCFANIY